MKKLFKENKQLSDLVPNILIISGVIGVLFIISLVFYYWWTIKVMDRNTPYLNNVLIEVIDKQEGINDSADMPESNNNQQQDNFNQNTTIPDDDDPVLPPNEDPPWEQGPSDPSPGGGSSESSSNPPNEDPPWEQGPST